MSRCPGFRPNLASLRRFICLFALGLVLTAGLALSSGHVEAGPLPIVDQQPANGPLAAFNVIIPGQADPAANGRVHDTLTFDASSSQGGGLQYGWDFGDGSPPIAGQKVTHAFSTINDYTVTLTVSDQTGKTASTTKSVRIIPLIDSLVSVPPLKQVMIGAVIPVLLYLQAPGISDLNANLSGDLISGKPSTFSTGDQLAYASLTAQVANETNSTIDQKIIQQPGGNIPLQGNVGLHLTYQTPAGKDVDLNFLVSLQKDRDPNKGVWSITYPNFSLDTGTTDPNEPDQDGYYLKGDPGFHHGSDPLVRRYTMRAARAGGVLSDDPAQVMENLYTYSAGLFGSDDPAQIEPDTVVVQKIADGELVPGAQSEKYICISQTYFLTSMARTVGLASRELTIALGNPVDQNRSGAWTVDYVQEGAAEIWFDNSWHLYDTWMHIRNLDDYLNRRYAYQAWYSYSAQDYDLIAKNGDPLDLYGHNFAIGEYEGTPADPNEWYLRQAKERAGVTVEGFPTN